MLKRLLLTLGLGLAILIPLAALAVSSPLDMLQTTSQQMISELKTNQSTIKSDPKRVYSIVNKVLIPHVDREEMARAVVGRVAWNAATPADQQEFIKQFTHMLVNTYAAALASYTDQKVVFSPIRGGWENQQQLEVQSQIIQSGGPAIPVSYHLALENQQWMVTDFSVDNVSIISNFRAQFASDLQQMGLKGLNTKLAAHNRAAG